MKWLITMWNLDRVSSTKRTWANLDSFAVTKRIKVRPGPDASMSALGGILGPSAGLSFAEVAMSQLGGVLDPRAGSSFTKMAVSGSEAGELSLLKGLSFWIVLVKKDLMMRRRGEKREAAIAIV